MKKIAALLLALALLPAVSAAEEAPEVFDTAWFEANSGIYEITVGEDGGAVIAQRDSAARGAFAAPYASDAYPSTVYPELVVLGYAGQERKAALRIRILYNGTKELNLSGATFVTDRYEYTFTDLPCTKTAREDGTFCESLVLVTGGGGGTQFLADLLTAAMEYTSRKYSEGGDDTALPAWSLVLHGDEDVTAAPAEGFWTDLGLFFVALDSMHETSFLTREEGWPCEITQIK